MNIHSLQHQRCFLTALSGLDVGQGGEIARVGAFSCSVHVFRKSPQVRVAICILLSFFAVACSVIWHAPPYMEHVSNCSCLTIPPGILESQAKRESQGRDRAVCFRHLKNKTSKLRRETLWGKQQGTGQAGQPTRKVWQTSK